MIWPTYAPYVLTVGFIRISKWIELQVLKLFAPLLKSQGLKLTASLGVILHSDKYSVGQDDLQKGAHESRKLTSRKSKKYTKLVHMKYTNDSYFTRVANTGLLGLGECFMDGTLDYCNNPEELTEMGTRILENNKLDLYYNWWNKALEYLELHVFNLQTRKRAFQVGKVHYDLGNELYQLMLDSWMQYTCGYWKDVDNLNDAQTNKMDLIAKKLDLKPGMRVLDLGCGWGWGTLCKYLAENYKVECVGVTIGEQGALYGKEACIGLPVEIRVQDYRDVNEQFDRIVSVGLMEHVGFHNYREFFKVARRCLKDDGIFLVHTIARNHSNFPLGSIPWAHHYIFPNGFLPDPMMILEATKDLFIIEDWHNFGPDYAKTLEAWRENFINGWSQIKDKFDDRFYRMWICYLSLSISIFRARRCQLWQIVLSKDGLKREYRAAR